MPGPLQLAPRVQLERRLRSGAICALYYRRHIRRWDDHAPFLIGLIVIAIIMGETLYAFAPDVLHAWERKIVRLVTE